VLEWERRVLVGMWCALGARGVLPVPHTAGGYADPWLPFATVFAALVGATAGTGAVAARPGPRPGTPASVARRTARSTKTSGRRVRLSARGGAILSPDCTSRATLVFLLLFVVLVVVVFIVVHFVFISVIVLVKDDVVPASGVPRCRTTMTNRNVAVRRQSEMSWYRDISRCRAPATLKLRVTEGTIHARHSPRPWSRGAPRAP